jgi:DNA-directed RNA polymerase specialized sigma subunit
LSKLNQEALDWLKKHEHLLPSMMDGERINYDPIIYFNPSETWRTKALELKRQREALDALLPQDENRRAVHLALMFKILESKITPMQLICLLGKMQGITQDGIAKVLGVPRQTVAYSQDKAIKVIAKKRHDKHRQTNEILKNIGIKPYI